MWVRRANHAAMEIQEFTQMGATMKRITYVWLAAMVVTGILAALAGAQNQSLGDYARKVRKDNDQKPAAVKKYDNDNLPKDDKLSVVGNPPPEPAKKEGESAENAAQPAAGAEAEKKTEEGPESAADRQKRFDQWKSKIADQKSQLDLASRELDIEQREYRLRAAQFYGDAGERLRNSAQWDKEDAQYKQKIAEKQKAVDSAKQKLESLQEQARRDGVPASVRQ